MGKGIRFIIALGALAFVGAILAKLFEPFGQELWKQAEVDSSNWVAPTLSALKNP